MAKGKATLMKIAFPETTVELPGGRSIVMRPIPARRIGSIMKSLVSVAGAAAEGTNYLQIFQSLSSEMEELIDISLVDCTLDQITLNDIPFVLDKWFELNLSEQAMDFWRRLIERFSTFRDAAKPSESAPEGS